MIPWWLWLLFGWILLDIVIVGAWCAVIERNTRKRDRSE